MSNIVTYCGSYMISLSNKCKRFSVSISPIWHQTLKRENIISFWWNYQFFWDYMETVCRKPGVQTPCAKHDRKQLPSIYLSVWVAGCLMPCSQAFYVWSLATWCMMGSDHSPGVKTLNCPFNHRSIEMLRNLGFTCSSVCSQTCAINRLQRALQKGKLLIALVFVSLGAAGEGGARQNQNTFKLVLSTSLKIKTVTEMKVAALH